MRTFSFICLIILLTTIFPPLVPVCTTQRRRMTAMSPWVIFNDLKMRAETHARMPFESPLSPLRRQLANAQHNEYVEEMQAPHRRLKKTRSACTSLERVSTSLERVNTSLTSLPISQASSNSANELLAMCTVKSFITALDWARRRPTWWMRGCVDAPPVEASHQ